jgi:hypothetical protein
MKVRTKHGWFEMSDIFSISNLETRENFNFNIQNCIESIDIKFDVYSKYESVIRNITNKVNLNESALQKYKYDWDKTERILDERHRTIKRKLIIDELNKFLKGSAQKEYDDFVNLWLENK